jgi:hypothetical protein
MSRYLIYAAHEPEECVKTLDYYLQAGAHYLTHAEWGCSGGVHAEWLIVEAESESDALLMVPPIVRRQAQLIKLNRFSPEQIRALHKDQIQGSRR